ncbi:MAG: glycosyltransferase [Candidatus Hydrogenedentes bacterium]|nr:glycosyltransferase [Candidatus Hydrogenedentota bacterium]
MKILHLDEQRGWRGGEQQASWLLAGSVARGHEVWIAGRRTGQFVHADHGGASVKRLPLTFANELDLATAWRLAQVVKQERIDIIHAHTSHAHTTACMTARFAGRGKTVVSRRIDFMPKQNRFNQWKYSWPDLYIAVSDRVAQVLRQFGIPEPRLRMVHSSVDRKRLECAPADWATLGIKKVGPIILSAGALVGHKDHENLLRAFAGVRKQLPGAQIVIAGEGGLRASIEQQIRDLDLTHAVHLLGHRTDVPALMRAADLYVSSSWSEGLGTSILEALACGTPVAATEAGGAREMVAPGLTGYLVPVRDSAALGAAIVQSLHGGAETGKMVAAGRARIQEEFTTETMVERTLACYIHLLD